MRQLITISFLFILTNIFSQKYYSQINGNILLDNGLIKREIKFENMNLSTSMLKIVGDTNSYVQKSNDFSFHVNDKLYSGFDKWEVIEISPISDCKDGNGVNIKVRESGENPQIEIEINFLLYPNLPIIRKWIKFKNIGKCDIKLEEVNIENLNTNLLNHNSVVYHNYARMKHISRFVGDWDDPVVVVHDINQRKGIALGNEAIGVLKRTAYHTTNNNVEIGLTHQGQSFPFRKYLKPAESWVSPKTFICLYTKRDDGFEVIDNEVNRFITFYMNNRISTTKSKPVFVYNTWFPFTSNINDSLVRTVAKAASDCGITEFVIDDGWQVNYNAKSSTKSWGENYGDWLVDTKKFPDGLKPTFDYIKSLGMKPGLWISLASASRNSKVFSEHPEWFVQTKEGKLGNIHYESKTDDSFYSASLGTDWKDYIKERINRLVNEYGLCYAKLDLAVVTSPYVNNDSVSGSYAKNHPYYRDHNESFIVHYERMLQLFDELHTESPELFIDCTFETAGKYQLMDYAIAQHAEGNWFSNFSTPSPVGPLRVRQMAWWRTPALPASSLVLGNLALDDPEFEFCLKSLIGTFPIVLGDPRKIPMEKRAEIKKWAVWLEKMQSKYDYMSYRRDLAGFGEPKEGSWDGWQRINFQTQKGGIFGVFRQNALEKSRIIFLKDLLPDKIYSIKQAPENKLIKKASGKNLMQKGLEVKMEKSYDGKIFEVGIEN